MRRESVNPWEWGLTWSMDQAELLPGDLHWLIRVLHLLIGIGAVGFAETLGVRIRRRALTPAAA